MSRIAALVAFAMLAGCSSKKACIGGVLYYEQGDGVYIRDEWARACVNAPNKEPKP